MDVGDLSQDLRDRVAGEARNLEKVAGQIEIAAGMDVVPAVLLGMLTTRAGNAWRELNKVVNEVRRAYAQSERGGDGAKGDG